jgi:uncharacterized protein (DUF1501 family)
MDTVTRRKFLLASGVSGAAALAAGAGTLALRELLDRADSADRDQPVTDKLVIVTLYGGNDGLNTVVPHTDPVYQSVRPGLAYGSDQVLHLDQTLGLNPALAGLKRMWDDKRLAIILGVGYPKPDHSHFRSMDIWQTAAPDAPVGSGWVGRWLDAVDATPETAVSFEPVLPPLLAGTTRTGSCVAVGGLRLPGKADLQSLAALGRSQAGESELQARAATTLRDFLDVDRLIRQAQQASIDTHPSDLPSVPATNTGGQSVLDAQLTLVNQCIEAGIPTRVYSVSLGGFDTHAVERSAHERLLRQLDKALSAFAQRLAKSRAGSRTTVMIYSEFGRRVRGNGSEGTDHGTAGPVFVFGPRVNGGFHGQQPSLTDLDDGDLKMTTDFRDVYGTVLRSVLHADPEQIIRNYQPRQLPLFGA